MSVIHQEDGHSYHYKVVDSADSMKKVWLCLFLVAVFSLCRSSRAVRACVRVCGCVSVCLVLIMSLSLVLIMSLSLVLSFQREGIDTRSMQGKSGEKTHRRKKNDFVNCFFLRSVV